MDGYAGTGAVGIEALSRGAARCVFVENGRRAVEAIRENLRALGMEGRASVVVGSVSILYLPKTGMEEYFLRRYPGSSGGWSWVSVSARVVSWVWTMDTTTA